MRPSGRTAQQIRPVTITRNFTKHAEGSVLIEFGDTKVLCNATVETGVPRFLKGQGQGWVTAEYSMLPRSTHTRSQREAARGKQGGRTMEIQRLIGRGLRAVADLSALGERTLWIDCDVLQADGGTRTAAITGGYTALALACKRLQKRGEAVTDVCDLDAQAHRSFTDAESTDAVVKESLVAELGGELASEDLRQVGNEVHLVVSLGRRDLVGRLFELFTR